ncbi:CotS family spore coat protein [Clostridium sp. DL1XJH146]
MDNDQHPINDIFAEENIRNNVLPHFNLEKSEIFKVKFKNTDKQRAVYKVIHKDNTYCLKKVYFDKKDLLFVYSAIEWLYRYDIHVPRILPSKNKNKFATYNDMLFILTPWIEGEKCEYDNIDNVKKACLNLGLLHNASSSFYPIEGSSNRVGYNNLYASVNTHFDRLILNSKLAFKYKDSFSKLYLEYFSQAISLAKKSCLSLSSVNENNLNTSLCHMDYVNKNIIFDNYNDIWVIDFDKCRMDFSVHDLSYFYRRYLKREGTNWNFKSFKETIIEYETIRELSLDEFKYLLGYLAFPQKYWKISRDYYRNIRYCNKKAFITIINKSISTIDDHINFINDMRNYIEKRFQTTLNI